MKTCSYDNTTFNNLPSLCDQDGFSAAISWSSNKLTRAVRSTLAAETLAFAEDTDVASCTKELTGEILHADNEMLCEIESFTDSMSLFETTGTSSQVNVPRLSRS